MRKIVIFTVIALVSQMFCVNGFGQEYSAEKYNVYYNEQSTKKKAGALGYFYNSLHLESENGYPIFFSPSGVHGLQMLKGPYNDFTLWFPISSDKNDKWNRIIARDQLAFFTGNRGLTNSDGADLLISTSGNIGIGTTTPSEKLTVAGNIKLEDNGKLIGDNLEFRGGYISFDVSEHSNSIGLQMFKGPNIDGGGNIFYFPSNLNVNYLQNRIFFKRDLGFTAGEPNGFDNADLLLSETGNIGIGERNPDEKLTVAGNLRVNKGKVLINANINEIDEDILSEFSLFVADGILSEDFAIGPKEDWADHVFSNDYELNNLNEVENYIKTNNHLPNIPSASEVKKKGYNLHDMNVKLLEKVEELTLYSIEQNKEIEQLKKVVNSYESLLEKVNKLESQINK